LARIAGDVLADVAQDAVNGSTVSYRVSDSAHELSRSVPALELSTRGVKLVPKSHCEPSLLPAAVGQDLLADDDPPNEAIHQPFLGGCFAPVVVLSGHSAEQDGFAVPVVREHVGFELSSW